MAVLVTNNAWGKLKAMITADATSFTLESSQGERFPVLSSSGKDCFYCTLINESNELEIVKCIARSKDTFTVERGQSDTTKKIFLAGSRVELRPVKELFESFVNKGDNDEWQEEQDDRLEALEKKNSAPSATDITEFKKLYNLGGLGDDNTWTGTNTYSKAPVFSKGFTSNGTGVFNADIKLNQDSSSTSLNCFKLWGIMADTCAWRIRATGFAKTTGAVTTYKGNGQWEFATSGDGDEPIYFRQYSGTTNFTTVKRTLTLLDADGNTSIPGDVTIAGDLVSKTSKTSSDRRLKREFKPVENALDMVNGVQCYSYKRLDMPGDYIGLVAQDVQEVCPLAVSEGEGGYLNVDPYALVSVLYQAVKEQQKQIEELKAEVAKKADKRSRAK